MLGFTQCTALMAADPTWEGIARGILALGVLWWAWAAYAWLTSVVDPEEGAVRFAFFAAMAGLLVVALCVPEAFGDRALPFAIAYGVVRAGHIALFMLASRDDPSLRRSIAGLAISTAASVALLIGASSLDGVAQGAAWALAIAVDTASPGLFGAEGWRLEPSHFAERHNLVIILALGESIVALGVGAEVELEARMYVAVALGIALASALWWIYFDVVALITERRLVAAPAGRARNLLARDSYTYLHFPMVAGIVLAALGLEQILHHLEEPLHAEPAFALLGGVAIYLLAHVALRLRNAHSINGERLGLAIALLVLWPFADLVGVLVVLGLVCAALWALIAFETIRRYGSHRYALRHGLEPELPDAR